MLDKCLYVSGSSWLGDYQNSPAGGACIYFRKQNPQRKKRETKSHFQSSPVSTKYPSTFPALLTTTSFLALIQTKHVWHSPTQRWNIKKPKTWRIFIFWVYLSYLFANTSHWGFRAMKEDVFSKHKFQNINQMGKYLLPIFAQEVAVW
jgi:hypothetical protein